MRQICMLLTAFCLGIGSAALPLPTGPTSAAHAQANITMEQAIAIALREVPGTVIEVEREGGAYEVEILDADRIEWSVLVRIRDGAVLRVEPD